MNQSAKLNILKAIVLGMMIAGTLGGCAEQAPPPAEPAGVIDLVPGQPSVIQPPANQPVQNSSLQERPI